MIATSTRAKLLASSMITGVALTGAGVAHAADTAAASSGTAVQEIVVTGSRIPQANLSSISPITTVNSNEIKLEGTTRVEDLINNLPQAFADQGGGLSNGATGTATVNLRNLGPSRTLVLIDGRRVVPGDPNYPYADLNFIPAALIDRVEIDTGGASSVYGSDAVAGVVNFKIKRDFEGVRVDANASFYQHGNGDSYVQGLNQAKGFPLPSGSVADGWSKDFTVIFGANSPDDKGNVTAYLEYRNIEAVRQDQRDYSNCALALNSAKSGFKCSGSALVPNGLFAVYGPGGTTTQTLTLDQAHPNQFRPFTGVGPDVYNYAPTNYYQRPDERYSGGFFAHYDINSWLKPYAEFMFMDDHTVAQIAPTPLGNTYFISCSNPLLSAQEVNTLCGDPAQVTNGGRNIFIGKRNVEGGPRRDDLRHTDYRAVIGSKGDLGGSWHYDIYAQFGASVYNENYQNEMSRDRIGKALNVVSDANGNPVCQSVLDGSDTNCLPYNIFTVGGVTPQAEQYVSASGFKSGITTEQVVSGSITGNLGDYGVKSPYASEGVGVAFGAEYRREYLDLRVDQEFASGDLAGQGGATPPEHGAFDVKEIFAEVRAPLVQDMPFAKEITLEAGYRFSHYSSAGDNNTYKVGGDWRVNDDIRLRASYNRAVRAPNVLELFSPQNVQLDFNVDPCAGATPQFTAAQCVNTGVPLARYGTIGANPAEQYNGKVGGNPDLRPETADTYSVGMVLTPTRYIPGFSLSVDYYNISVTNVIQGYGSQYIINTCGTTGDPFFCGLVHRAPGSLSLWQGFNGYVVNVKQNTGYVKTAGIDFDANYRLGLHDVGSHDWGSLAFEMIGTYTDHYDLQAVAGGTPLNCLGLYGTTCQGTGTPQTAPVPEWRHKFRVTWNTPWKDLAMSINWRYIAPISVDTGDTTFDSHIGAYNYIDLAATWRLKDRYNFRIGINNLFDRDPPLIALSYLPSTVGNGNTFPQVYDALGRYIFMGVTADF